MTRRIERLSYKPGMTKRIIIIAAVAIATLSGCGSSADTSPTSNDAAPIENIELPAEEPSGDAARAGAEPQAAPSAEDQAMIDDALANPQDYHGMIDSSEAAARQQEDGVSQAIESAR